MRRNSLLSSSFLGTSIGLATLASAAGGCNWTDFDDLADSTPVDRISDPDEVPSADFARLITEGVAGPNEGSSVAVLSSSELTLSFVAFEATGDSSIPGETVSKIKTKFTASPAFPATASFFSDYITDDIAITTVDNVGQQSFVLYGHTALTPKRSVIAQINPAFGAFIHQSTPVAPAEHPRLIAFGSATKVFTIVADTAATDSTPETECTFTTDGTSIAAMSSGELDGDPANGGEVAIWFKSGFVRIFAADVFAACTNSEPTATLEFNSLVIPGDGDRIFITSRKRVILGKFGTEGQIKVLDYSAGLATAPTVDGAQMLPNLGSMSFGDLDGDETDEIVGGFPTEEAEGTSGAGVAKVYGITGGTLQEKLVLHDADPSSDQAFGRTVLIAPFNANGDSALYIGASQALFTYFSTPLYPDVRQQ